MSPPLRPAARTRTSTSPLPGRGSGCSSMTSCWSRIVTARIAAEAYLRSGCGPLEQRHALDVMRLGEHVDGPDPAQLPSRLDQFGRVGRERRGVARHVDDPLGRGFDDPMDDLLGEARAGRVDDYHVRAAG